MTTLNPSVFMECWNFVFTRFFLYNLGDRFYTLLVSGTHLENHAEFICNLFLFGSTIYMKRCSKPATWIYCPQQLQPPMLTCCKLLLSDIRKNAFFEHHYLSHCIKNIMFISYFYFLSFNMENALLAKINQKNL